MIHRSTAALLSLSLGLGCAAPAAPATQATADHTEAPRATGRSTLDPRLQAIADEELGRAIAEHEGALAGAVVVLDPRSGEILANAGRAGGTVSSVGIQRAYVTGSTLKTILAAAALDAGVVSVDDRFDCLQGQRAYGDKVMRDATPRGVLSLPEMLAVSTNVGFSQVAERLGGDGVERWYRRFHFGAAPGELPVPIDVRTFGGAWLAVGEIMTATPLQMAAAYAIFANEGAYVPPTFTRRDSAPPREQVIKPETAKVVLRMLDGVVNGPLGTGARARVPGVHVVGKTGTAEFPKADGTRGYYGSFVGIVPADAPRWVVLAGVESAKEGYLGGTLAAPLFARVVSRALQK